MMDHVIEVENLLHRYGSQVAVNDLSFYVRKGEVLGLLGPNGAGKTTTVRLLNGLFSPVSGRMRVLGFDPLTQGNEIRRRSGVLTETPALYERLTASQNLNFFGTLAGMPPDILAARSQELLTFFGLQERAADRVGVFSKGMKQRMALARALLHNPALLFLDEPTAGLDPEAAHQVHGLIHNIREHNGQTVMICTHNLYEAEKLCDRLAVINRGRLLAIGTLEELRRQVMPDHWVEIALLTPPLPALSQGWVSLRGVRAVQMQQTDVWRFQVECREDIPVLVSSLAQQGAQILSVAPLTASLEEIYFQLQAGEA